MGGGWGGGGGGGGGGRELAGVWCMGVLVLTIFSSRPGGLRMKYSSGAYRKLMIAIIHSILKIKTHLTETKGKHLLWRKSHKNLF